MTQNQKDIITDLIIDNGLIWDQTVKDYLTNDFVTLPTQFFDRMRSIVKYSHTLFMEVAYNESIDDVDYVQMRLVNLLAAIVKYRNDYEKGYFAYNVMNSFFDKTSETFNDFMKTI